MTYKITLLIIGDKVRHKDGRVAVIQHIGHDIKDYKLL